MTTPAASAPRPQPKSRPASQRLRVGRELLDTTWRMAVPVVLFAGLGIVADRTLGSRPWATLCGMAVGFVFAALLVKRQLDRWPTNEMDGPLGTSRTNPGSCKNYYTEDDEDKDYYDD